MTHRCLDACTVSAQFKFHQKSVYYTVVLFLERPGCFNCWLGAIIYRHCFSLLLWLTLPGVHLLQSIASFRVFEAHISSPAFLTRSFCWTAKLKVNSTYWPHLERPFTCGESRPVWTRWQTEILIIPLLLSSEEVEMFFRAQQMSSVQSLSKVTYEMTNGSGPLCPFFFPHVCVWWEGWHLFVSMEIWNQEGIAMDTENPVGVRFGVALFCWKLCPYI